MSHPSHVDITKDFQEKDKNIQSLFPVSFRVSAEEKAILKKMAGCFVVLPKNRTILSEKNSLIC